MGEDRSQQIQQAAQAVVDRLRAREPIVAASADRADELSALAAAARKLLNDVDGVNCALLDAGAVGERGAFSALVDALALALRAPQELQGADKAAAVRARIEAEAAAGRRSVVMVDGATGLSEQIVAYLARLAAGEPGRSPVQAAIFANAAALKVLENAVDPATRAAAQTAVAIPDPEPSSEPPQPEAEQAAAAVGDENPFAGDAPVEDEGRDVSDKEAFAAAAANAERRGYGALWAALPGLAIGLGVGYAVWGAITPSDEAAPKIETAAISERSAPAPAAPQEQAPTDAASAETAPAGPDLSPLRARLAAGLLFGDPQTDAPSLAAALISAGSQPGARRSEIAALGDALSEELKNRARASLKKKDFAAYRKAADELLRLEKAALTAAESSR